MTSCATATNNLCNPAWLVKIYAPRWLVMQITNESQQADTEKMPIHADFG